MAKQLDGPDLHDHLHAAVPQELHDLGRAYVLLEQLRTVRLPEDVRPDLLRVDSKAAPPATCT